jgi:ribonuclease Z
LHALPRRSIAVCFTPVSGIDSPSQVLPSRANTGPFDLAAWVECGQSIIEKLACPANADLRAMNMKRLSIAMAFVGSVWLAVDVPTAEAAPCLIVTLTGSMGGPPIFNGLAGPGTLVRYGEDSNNCDAVKLQFDAGRGTNMRLSQIGIPIEELHAVFFTHMHTDHTEGFADILQLRWHWNSTGPKIDVVCSSDTVSPLGFTISCKKFVLHIADPFIQSGEIAQRLSEVKERLAGGPADLTNVITFEPKDEPQLVWSSGEVKVSAIRSTHMAGHASYRVDTPAGSVVIGGDAGNDVLAPPRASSTSDQVEKLAKGVDIIVHSTMHPVMGPDRDSGLPPPIFYRQSGTTDLGANGEAGRCEISHAYASVPAHRSGAYRSV